MSTASNEVIRFPCECGAVLKARTSQVGRKGKCQRCGQVLVIPDPATLSPSEVSDEDAVDIQEVCSICQTGIEDDDERTNCEECGLPFHVECWQENLGCSAYGCKNVNVLKTGPDISIGDVGQAPPMLPPTPTQPAAFNPTTPWTAPSPAAAPQRPATPDVEIPWEYVVLAGSALAALCSIVMCGFPSLLMGIVALLQGITQHRRIGWTIPGISVALSTIGMFVGFCLSTMFWMI